MNLHAEANLGRKLGRRTLAAREEPDRPGTWTLDAIEGSPNLRATVLLWLDDAVELGQRWQVQSECDAVMSGAARVDDPLRLQLTVPSDAGAQLLLMLQGFPGPITILLPLTVVEDEAFAPRGEADAAEPMDGPAVAAETATAGEAVADEVEADEAVDRTRLDAPPPPNDVDWVRPAQQPQHSVADRLIAEPSGPDAGPDAVRAERRVRIEEPAIVPKRRTGPPWSVWLLVAAIGLVALLVALKTDPLNQDSSGGGADVGLTALTGDREEAIQAFGAQEWFPRRQGYVESGKPAWVEAEGHGTGEVTLAGRTPADMAWNKEDGIITGYMTLSGPIDVSVTTDLPTGADSCSVGMALLGAVVNMSDPKERPSRFAAELQHDATGTFATAAVVKQWDFTSYPDSTIREKIEEQQATYNNQDARNYAAYWPTPTSAVAWWLVPEAFGGAKLPIDRGGHQVRLSYDPGNQRVKGYVDARPLGEIAVHLGRQVRLTLYMSTSERGVRMRAQFSDLRIEHAGPR